MSRPAPDGGHGSGVVAHSADADDAAFDKAADAIEAAYADLKGVEAVSKAFTDAYGAHMLGNEPELGDGVGTGLFIFDMPTTPSYEVQTMLAQTDNDAAKAQIYQIFAQGHAAGSGVADSLRSLAQHLYGVDPDAIDQGAADQLHAVKHFAGRLGSDWALIEALVRRDFHSGTTEEFETWYGQVSRVMGELAYYGGVAQVNAKATANVIRVAKKTNVTIMEKAQANFEATMQKWRDDHENFPFQPGVSDQAMAEFVSLLTKTEGYAKMIPGVGKYLEPVDKGVEVIGVLDDLFGTDDPKVMDIAPRADPLLEHLRDQLAHQNTDAQKSLGQLGHQTGQDRREVESRAYLWLKRIPHPGAPGWNYEPD